MEYLQSYKHIEFHSGYHIVIREDNTICQKGVNLVLNEHIKKIPTKRLIKDLVNKYKDIDKITELTFDNRLNIKEITIVKNGLLHNDNGYALMTIGKNSDYPRFLNNSYLLDGWSYSIYDYFRDERVIRKQRMKKIESIFIN